jgi:amino acid permease
LIATLVVAAIETFTLYVLARYAEATGSATYSQLVRKMLGRKASLAMSIVLIIYSYGSATAYLIILGDCFQPMVAEAFGQTWWTARDPVILGLATAFMLPLCFPRTLHAISAFSSVTFYALCAVVGLVVHRSVQAVRAPDYDWSAVHAFGRPLETLDALPILAFGFQVGGWGLVEAWLQCCFSGWQTVCCCSWREVGWISAAHCTPSVQSS